MNKRHDRSAIVLLLAMLSVIVGCSGKPPAPPKLAPTVPLTGAVTLDDKPLADATVNFIPEVQGGFRGAMGRTDASGKYELTTDIGGGKANKGAIPGKYKVTVSKLVKPDGTPIPADSKEPPMNLGAMESIPLQYSSYGETQLVFDVPSAGGTYDIPLKSK